MKYRILIVLLIGLLTMGAALAQDSERETITTDNISALELLIRLGRGSGETVAYSADGQHVFVAGSVGIWKYDTADLSTETEPELLDVGGGVSAMAVHPDGAQLAIYGDNSDGLEFIDANTGELLGGVEIENRPLFIEYSARGDHIVLNYGSRGVALLNTVDETSVSASGSFSTNSRAVVSADGSKFLAADNSGSIFMWDATIDAEPMELEGHTQRVYDLVISPDQSLLVSASQDDSFIVWDLASGTMLQQFPQPEDDSANLDVFALAFTPDDSTLITGHRAKVRFWDVASRSMTGEAETGGSVTEIRVAPDGEQFIVRTSTNANAVQQFSIDGTLLATTTYHNNSVAAASFSPDSAVLSFSDSDRFLYMWDTATAGEINTATKIEDGATTGLLNHENNVFSNDNNYLATLLSFSAALRDPVTGELIHELEDLDGIAEDLAFSPDNTMLAVATSAGLYVFDVETGQRIAQFLDSYDWVQDVTWSPDQTMLVAVSGDQVLRLYTIGS